MRKLNGFRLKVGRLYLGLTQVEMSKKLHISQAAISAIETESYDSESVRLLYTLALLELIDDSDPMKETLKKARED